MRYAVQTMINEVRRELKLRQQCYPRLIAARKMSQGTAEERVEILEEVLALLITLRNRNDTGPLT